MEKLSFGENVVSFLVLFVPNRVKKLGFTKRRDSFLHSSIFLFISFLINSCNFFVVLIN
jgi:hypothetical protein